MKRAFFLMAIFLLSLSAIFLEINAERPAIESNSIELTFLNEMG